MIKITRIIQHPRINPIEIMGVNNQQAMIHLEEHNSENMHYNCEPAVTLGPVLIPRILLIPWDINMPFILERGLFPICSAFPVAINRHKDRHLDRSYLYFLKPLFLLGQLHFTL